MKFAIGALLSVLLLTAGSFGQDLMAVYAHQADAPLEITGMMNSPTDLASRVDLKNKSDKTVIEFQIGWVTQAPSGCSAEPIAPIIEYARPEETRLKSGQQSYSLSYRVGTLKTRDLARKLKSRHLVLQFGVVYAKFDDGTKWKFNLKQRKSFGDDTFLHEFACTAAFERQSQQSKSCGAGFLLRDSDIALLTAQPSAAECAPDFCEFLCNPTSNFTNCTIVNNPAPGCPTDDLGRCCHTTNAQTNYYRVCYLRCCNPCPPGDTC
jgi:hypothetical protein